MGGMGGPVLAGTESRSQKLRITMPAVAAGQLQQLAGDERHFTANLYQAVRGADGNLIFSPESVSIAMGMLSGGAAGATAAQLAAAMQFSLPQAQLHPAFDALDLALASRGAGTAPGAFKLTALNALWAQNGFTILPAYLDLLAENYGAGVRRVDFAAMPEAARATVNQWVSSATGDKIPALLSPGDVQPDTRLILTNAVYFKAEWRSRFDKSRTRDGTFHTLVGTVTVPMMNAEGTVEYWRGDGYQAAALPYAGDSASMVLIVPEAGTFAAFEGALDAAALDAEARARDVDGVLDTVDARALGALADAARYSGEPVLCRRVLTVLRRRFPTTPASHAAAFQLGRIDDDGGDTRGALDWYRRYEAEAPRGPYAAEALGREMLDVERLSGRAAATPLAHAYVARFADGTYLLQARAILGQP